METKQHIFTIPTWKKLLREVKKYFQLNENENKTHPNLRDSTNAVLKGKFMSLNAFMQLKKDPNQYSNIPPKV